MKISKVFREAAELIEDSHSLCPLFGINAAYYCCSAIRRVYERDQPLLDNYPALDYFEKFFKPAASAASANWFDVPFAPTQKERDLNQETRRIALLLATEIAESEGL